MHCELRAFLLQPLRRLLPMFSALVMSTAPALAQNTEPPPSPMTPQQASMAKALQRAQAAVVGVSSVTVDGAGSAATLGSERQGSGVVIGADGLVLTIGYVILEADRVELRLSGERSVPARVVGYDLATGFGLLQALAPLRTEPVPLGTSGVFSGDEPLVIASGGSDGGLSLARLVSRRPFSGYWEYHIDGALFTAPPRFDHSGAALFNTDGELVGIGSLIVGNAMGDGAPPMRGNMFVPIDLLKPILGEMRERGASRDSTRAWLGLNCVEHEGQVRVLRLTASGPAEDAGLRPGDQIVSIDGTPVARLETLYKALWKSDAEREVTLEIRRAGAMQSVKLQSVDRMKTLRRPEGV